MHNASHFSVILNRHKISDPVKKTNSLPAPCGSKNYSKLSKLYFEMWG